MSDNENISMPLNGTWLAVLKAHLAVTTVLVPLFLGWMAWVTSEIYQVRSFMESGERFSQDDGRQLEHRSIEARNDLRESISARLDSQQTRIEQIHRTTDRILVILEKDEK